MLFSNSKWLSLYLKVLRYRNLLETLFAKQDRLLSLTSTEIIRTLMYQINWDAQLVAIKGPRGVGKTTLMLQYMKQHYEVYSREVLYCTLDSVYFSNHYLLELVDVFVKMEGSISSWTRYINIRLGARR